MTQTLHILSYIQNFSLIICGLCALSYLIANFYGGERLRQKKENYFLQLNWYTKKPLPVVLEEANSSYEGELHAFTQNDRNLCKNIIAACFFIYSVCLAISLSQLNTAQYSQEITKEIQK